MASSLSHEQTTSYWIASCEHAGKTVPVKYIPLFEKHSELLESHQGWDPGAEDLTHVIAQKINTETFVYSYTRLLIEPNRSIKHPQLFSAITKNLDNHEKQLLIENYYKPYRNRIEMSAKSALAEGNVVFHISVHTFTPVWKGKERMVDIGLLYDPGRKFEKKFSNKWGERLHSLCPKLKILMNQPYKGRSDGLTSYLRNQLNSEKYIGIELEVNQKFLTHPAKWNDLKKMIASSLENFDLPV